MVVRGLTTHISSLPGGSRLVWACGFLFTVLPSLTFAADMIEANGICKRYGPLEALRPVSFVLEAGQVVGIVGSSGAGKTTLLQILGTLDTPDAGTLTIEGKNPFTLSARELARFRNQRLGFIFQFHNLLPEFTALENVMLPGQLGGRPQRQVRGEAEALLARLGLTDRKNNYANQLSGGEQQRVAVARALLNRPATVLADEPSGNLDSANATLLHDLFFELCRDLGQSFIIVTHNPALADRCHQVIRMADGGIVGVEPDVVQGYQEKRPE